MHAPFRLVCLLCAAPALTACAPMLSLIGTNQTAVQVVAQVERVKLAGDGASFATSHKTITDHALSKATGKDCELFNIVTKEPVCKDPAPVVTAAADTQTPAATVPEAPVAETPVAPQTQAIANPGPAVLDFSNDQASGD